METTAACDERLPALGLCGRVRGGAVVLVHGRSVEVRPGLFTDGAWDGPFSARPDDTSLVTGLVGVVDDDRLELHSSRALGDRVFVVDRGGEGVWFSNSLPLILAALDDDLDQRSTTLQSRFMAAELGIRTSPRTFRTAKGIRVRVLFDEIASISADGVTVRQRPTAPPVRDFADYRERLAGAFDRTVANAADPARSHPLPPIPTISAGYDSTVIAVLSAEAGITEALTLLRYDAETGTELVDHPGEVAAHLGLELRGVDRTGWKERPGAIDAAIAAAGVTLMDAIMLSLESHVAGRTLVVGYLGDNLWDKHNFRTSHDVVQAFGAVSGRGLAEHRLEHGYLVFAPAIVAHTAQPSIIALANRPEMQPWSVGGRYDRPIARRIAEDAGIPRQAFATKKYAGSGRVGSSITAYRGRTREDRIAEMSESMSAEGAVAFVDYVERSILGDAGRAAAGVRFRLRVGHLGHEVYRRMDAVNFRVGRRLHRFGITTLVPRRVMQQLAARVVRHPDYTYLLPHWGTSVLKERVGDLGARLDAAADHS